MNHNPMNHKSIKYNIRRISNSSVRLTFEIQNSEIESRNQIWRIREEGGINRFKHEGLAMSRVEAKTFAIVSIVQRGDVVLIENRCSSGSTTPSIAFRIAEAFEPTPIADPASLYNNMRIELRAGQIETSDDRSFHFDDEEFRCFLRARHPHWLQTYVDEMLFSWRTHRPETYVIYAPSSWLEHDTITLSIYDPLRALTDFPHRLTKHLEEFCVRRLSLSKEQSVFKDVPLKNRSSNAVQNATYLLHHHRFQLTNEDLRRCAITAPVTAYRIRHLEINSRRTAILLASSFGVGWHTDRHTLGPLFRKEVFSSLTKFPEEWFRSNPDGLPHILGRLKSLLGIRLDGKELVRMLSRMAPAGRGPLFSYIASTI